ncbi:IPExxxVDY family protein [Subsaximicrobium wynnwilliamsii]|uniref:IPExxxVDY family protein n=1 Tax=Subsaximicrobium wynnwilliamsii TaxID=291179 RepID=A0A5C6ZHW3_9FLAO|nr:IPExxxVDY family protein [Subsaximicrobium wynnwilliamsii]TXD83761.1 IPExxxVDY family protein [Subsaximicrobium wynnwilliamsii]TXD89356.1 IPExxxVDY family protein [Subsaximicrobium wynnwilliamsii]TXE03597.1 IPExxxVDY family protein [Subsaximicrobium wynnwilliamsii]
MAMHKLLVDDFFDDSFLLLAVHCRLEDYRLAFLLNKYLELRLARRAQDLDYNYFAASYAIYEWEDSKFDTIWNLVANSCKRQENSIQSSGSLFDNQNVVTKINYLVPELKKADFLIKVSNENQQLDEKKILNSIQAIPQIITAYSADLNNIRSKEHLIFN